ncbi:flagellar biosynthetic protein FliR, partial [Salmonella enterica subsp. enterica serovar Infantis]
GLYFATFFDPVIQMNMRVLALIMYMLSMLLFLNFNGHLWIISLLVETIHTQPICRNPENSNPYMPHARAGAIKFLNGQKQA